MDAATIVGLLAEPDRRRVFAALVLGARTLPDAAAIARLDVRATGKALQRLQSAGLVDDTLQVRGELIKLAAVTAAPAPTEYVVDRFVRGDRLLSLPAQESKRRLVLDRVSQSFEPGRHYAECDVDAVLTAWTAGADVDHVTLRRFLVDDGFLDRAGGEYWRAGGSV